MSKEIHCCGCDQTVEARLTDGVEIYPHRKDLHKRPFWKCDQCKNYVGCHYKTENRTAPLGCIPTPAIKRARQDIHRILDPIWKNGCLSRGQVYQALSERLGHTYHTANIRSVEEALIAMRAVKELAS